MKTVSFLVVIVVTCIVAEVTKNTSETLKLQQNKTIDVHSHNSNKTAKSIHLPSGHQEHHNFTNLQRISNVLNVFSISELAHVWNQHEHEFNANCSRNMREYFHGLQKGNLWAVKSEYIYSLYATIFKEN